MNEGSPSVPEGSHTITISQAPALLQLRADDSKKDTKAKKKAKSKVRWDEKVVDNEFMNKKKTKICCIFHPNTPLDSDEEECEHEHGHDSSSSSSSSSSSDEDEGKSFDERRKARLERRKKKLEQQRTPSPNAYEIQPDYSEYRDKIRSKGA